MATSLKNFKIIIFVKNLFIYIKMLIFLFKKNYYDKNNQPIFLLGTNRSGASLIASILRQHPDLRSLSPNTTDVKIQKKRNHTLGFSEDFIWRYLENFYGDHYTRKKEGYLWGHPKYLINFYKEDFIFKRSLINEIYNIESKKIPFIKHSFFSLRLKLIKKIFPNAKIILNIRSYKDFIKSNFNKLSSDPSYNSNFKIKKPDLGLHWLMINSIATYHCEKYFKDNYFIFHHEKLYDSKFDNQLLLDEITKFLGIRKYNFNFDNVNLDFKFDKNITFEYEDFRNILNISKYESEIFKNG